MERLFYLTAPQLLPPKIPVLHHSQQGLPNIPTRLRKPTSHRRNQPRRWGVAGKPLRQLSRNVPRRGRVGGQLFKHRYAFFVAHVRRVGLPQHRFAPTVVPLWIEMKHIRQHRPVGAPRTEVDYGANQAR